MMGDNIYAEIFHILRVFFSTFFVKILQANEVLHFKVSFSSFVISSEEHQASFWN